MLRICIVVFVIAILSLVVLSTAISAKTPGDNDTKENTSGKGEAKTNANVQYVQSFIII